MQEILRDLRVLYIDVKYYVTSPFKRLFKGYDERDLWGLDYYIARRILPGIKAFRKQKLSGYPNGFKNHKEWLKAIDEMIYGLEEMLKDKWTERGQKGRELLGKFMTNLWD